jgi:hypothetical protein
MPMILNWDGSTLPDELRSLPAGRYVVEPADHVPQLHPDEEAGLEAALASLEQGRGVSVAEARARVESAARR